MKLWREERRLLAEVLGYAVCAAATSADVKPWKTCFPYKSSRVTGVSKSGLFVSNLTRCLRKPRDTKAGQFSSNGNVFVSLFGKARMPANDTAGSLFIRDNTILPGGLIIETETFLPGWRAVRNCDGYRLGRKIEEAKWNFFYLAGEVRAIVLGRAGTSALRRALRSLLAKPQARKFNSLEITGTRQRWFLGIPFVTITANFRHIQQSLALNRANDFTLKTPAAPEAAINAEKYGTLVSSS